MAIPVEQATVATATAENMVAWVMELSNRVAQLAESTTREHNALHREVADVDSLLDAMAESEARFVAMRTLVDDLQTQVAGIQGAGRSYPDDGAMTAKEKRARMDKMIQCTSHLKLFRSALQTGCVQAVGRGHHGSRRPVLARHGAGHGASQLGRGESDW